MGLYVEVLWHKLLKKNVESRIEIDTKGMALFDKVNSIPGAWSAIFYPHQILQGTCQNLKSRQAPCGTWVWVRWCAGVGVWVVVEGTKYPSSKMRSSSSSRRLQGECIYPCIQLQFNCLLCFFLLFCATVNPENIRTFSDSEEKGVYVAEPSIPPTHKEGLVIGKRRLSKPL